MLLNLPCLSVISFMLNMWDLLLCRSFGIQHDGNGNDCEPVGKRPFVMSPQLLYGTSLPQWSRCSREYITRFLEWVAQIRTSNWTFSLVAQCVCVCGGVWGGVSHEEIRNRKVLGCTVEECLFSHAATQFSSSKLRIRIKNSIYAPDVQYCVQKQKLLFSRNSSKILLCMYPDVGKVWHLLIQATHLRTKLAMFLPHAQDALSLSLPPHTHMHTQTHTHAALSSADNYQTTVASFFDLKEAHFHVTKPPVLIAQHFLLLSKRQDFQTSTKQTCR